jgi:hypothetical protein
MSTTPLHDMCMDLIGRWLHRRMITMAFRHLRDAANVLAVIACGLFVVACGLSILFGPPHVLIAAAIITGACIIAAAILWALKPAPFVVEFRREK